MPVEWFLTLSVVMFVGGLFGVLTQKNAMRILISVEIMLNAANLAFMAFNGVFYNADFPNSFSASDFEGWVFVFIIIGVAAAEAAIGLAIFLSVYRNFGEIQITNIFTLKEQEV
ncbi:MAG: NADH-quinone oxidoreductase subunit NuoK [Candidatus Heimdallarchaeota archaeon]|nr:NADH-quinone oxidoreductase subunit NuoK [Candidatus Heimdallarchaeota archaeon]MDH5645466.1 NADH-quinone oxidoreductase subunit NuoK [Candidatus Heimdallarchaeota archaeon]